MPGMPEPMDLLALLRRDLALEPDEAALASEPLAQLGGVEVGQRRGEQLDASSTSMMRCGSANSEGVRTSVARTSPLRSRISGRAVADGVRRCRAPRQVAVRRGREHDQPGGDDAIDRSEKMRIGQADARPRFGGAIDVAAVEQACA